MVDQIFVNEHIQNGQTQCCVRAGDKLQHLVGATGKPIYARVGHDKFRSPLHELNERMTPKTVGV